jgi:uncharacterized membrane protein YgdD (TMEM256/DUF423 family)
MDRLFIGSGAALGFLAVAMGAFAAHALKTRVSPSDLENFKTAAHYQIVHALALVAVGILWRSQPSVWLARSGAAFLIGTVIFSGTLYALVLLQQRFLGAVTPIGGVALLVGWALLLVAALKS